MISITIGVVLAVVLVLVGMPVAFAFGFGGFFALFFAPIPSAFAIPSALKQASSFALLALPLFIMAGLLMRDGGIADAMLNLVDSVVGRIKGGLGAVTAITCAIFGAASGASSPAIASIGSIMIPKMEKEGYDRGYATALVACTSILCLLIPPSIPMIVYATMSRQSVTMCFLSTIIPGTILMALYVMMNFIICRKDPKIKLAPKMDFGPHVKLISRSFLWSIPALIMPLAILGGIFGGVATPTESAAVACVVGVPIGMIAYRVLTLKKMGTSLVEAASVAGSIMILFFFIFMFSRVMIVQRVPDFIVDTVLGMSTNMYVVLAMVNVVLLIIGMLMDDISGTLLASFILLPVVGAVGVSPIHFAAIVGTNLGLGNITPPCAPLLYMTGRVGGVPLEKYIKPAVRFMVLGHLPVILLVTYLPQLSLFLPRLVYGQEAMGIFKFGW